MNFAFRNTDLICQGWYLPGAGGTCHVWIILKTHLAAAAKGEREEGIVVMGGAATETFM